MCTCEISTSHKIFLNHTNLYEFEDNILNFKNQCNNPLMYNLLTFTIPLNYEDLTSRIGSFTLFQIFPHEQAQ